MYSVTGDGITIYSDIYVTDSAKAVNPKLTLKDNAAGTLEITLPPGNAGYDYLERMKSEIKVFRDNEEIWSGRIISENKDFWNNRTITCEGELAYLNDTLQPPKKYDYPDKYLGIKNFLEAIMSVHNGKVSKNKKFTIGAVTVHETLSPIFTDNESTFSVISENLLKKFGGHLRIRKVGTTRYLDYLQNYPSTNSQEIRFGQNLLDFTRNWDNTSFATVIRPRGAKLEESDIPELEAHLEISDENSGSPYITNEDAIKKFGWIEQVVDFQDITDAKELKSKAEEYFNKQIFDSLVLEVKAVDLRYLGVTADSIGLLDEVRCISTPHGLDRTFPVSELTIQLDKPDNSTYVLGNTTQTTFTDTAISADSSIISEMKSKPTKQIILDAAKENATQIINSATRGYVTIGRTSDYTEFIAISSDKSFKPEGTLETVTRVDADGKETTSYQKVYFNNDTKLWMWNINGLGYSENGGRRYEVAITNDGAIVANFITAGTMSADRIRTGLLESTNGNSKWDLDTGEFVMKKGSIALGQPFGDWNGTFYVDDDGNMRASQGTIGGFTIDEYCIYNDKLWLDGDGLEFDWSENGTKYALGNFGSNSWETLNSVPGLTIDVEPNCHYIAWGVRKYESQSTYSVKLMYVNNKFGNYKSDTLNIECVLDMHGHAIKNADISNLSIPKPTFNDIKSAFGVTTVLNEDIYKFPLVDSNGLTGYRILKVKNGLITGYIDG